VRALGVRRLFALALIGLGAGCLLWYGIESVRSAAIQRRQEVVLEQMRDRRPAPAPGEAVAVPWEQAGKERLIGRLQIPRLNVSVIVMEGDDDATLKSAVGHLPDTAMPWENGNSALAGHRDTFFRPLRGIRVGDEIQLTTPRGTLVYHVRETRIVEPTDIEVLEPTQQPALTLVTCYPFFYVGAAPKRYVVRADRVEGNAQSSRSITQNAPMAAMPIEAGRITRRR
jgi:sortase A